jgi:hypothetical protein
MVVGDIVEELLRIQRSAKKKSKVSISCLNNQGNQIHCICTRKGVLIRQPVLLFLAEPNLFSKGVGNS